jgi:hypothetical protein
MRWFRLALEWLPADKKPIVFIPCGACYKTREKYGKMITSQSYSHLLLSPITKNKAYEKVVLSEPHTIIPYPLEMHSAFPDTEFPPNLLTIQSEHVFITQLALYLTRLKLAQPDRKVVYYLGGRHHYFILYYALRFAGSPFQLVFEVPTSDGFMDYTGMSRRLKKRIDDAEKTGVPIIPEPLDLSGMLKSRCDKVKRHFWKEVTVFKLFKNELTEYTENVGSKEDFDTGFKDCYEPVKEKVKNELTMPEVKQP